MYLNPKSTKLVQENEELLKSGKYGEANFILQQMAVEALNLLGHNYNNMELFSLGAKFLDLAAKVDPGFYPSHVNLCSSYAKMQDLKKSRKAAEKALETTEGGQAVESLFNMAVVNYDEGNIEKAIEYYYKILSIDKNHKHAKFNIGCTLLKARNYIDGWGFYESRFETTSKLAEDREKYRKAPNWNGEDLKNKKILFFNEQGTGDFIQSYRFIDLINKMKPKRIDVAVPPYLADLYKSSKLIVNNFYQDLTSIPDDYDFICSINSVPSILKLDYNKSLWQRPYISTLRKSTIENLSKTKHNVGVVTRGTPGHNYDWRRSIQNSKFAVLNECKNCNFYNMTIDTESSRKWNGKTVQLNDYDLGWTDLSSKIKDYSDTASLMKKMDFIITVDTSTVHLAGAMGIKTFALIDSSCDWRWGTNDPTTFWYPTVQLCRQLVEEDWSIVMNRLAQKIKSI